MDYRRRSRIEAYNYMVRMVKAFADGNSADDSDVLLAQEMHTSLQDIISLKSGESDPSDRMVRAFVEYIGPLMLKSQIDYYFINPFK